MKIYLRVFLQLIKNSLSSMLAYRADAILQMVIGFSWSVATLAVLEIIFLHTTSLNGWGKSDMILLLFSFTAAVDVSGSLGRSIEELGEDIQYGAFDIIITKPIDSQFYSLFRKPDLAGLFNFITHQIPYVILLVLHPPTIHWGWLPIYIIFIFLANILWLAIKTLIITLNFWWQHLGNLHHMIFSIAEIGRYPVSIFPYLIKFFFYTFIPIAFIAVVPTDVLRGNFSWIYLIGSVSATIIFVILSRLTWKRAIKSYTSASG